MNLHLASLALLRLLRTRFKKGRNHPINLHLASLTPFKQKMDCQQSERQIAQGEGGIYS